MDDEIEETQRQLHRSATLIQNAYEGLSTLHNRVSEVASLRVQGAESAPPVPYAPMPTDLTSVGNPPMRSAMDPGHDAIVLSSSDTTSVPVSATSTPTPAPLPVSATPTSPLRAARASDATLASLRSELLSSTQVVRERASELEELRRSILQYVQERQGLLAEGASSSGADAPSTVRESGNGGPPTGATRRLLLDYSLRHRTSDDAATSLGVMVAARSAANSSSNSNTDTTRNTHNTSTAPRNAAVAAITTATTSPTVESTRSSTAPIPPGITSRLTRLAQEIQQDIARITQQSESLMSWINEHRARLDNVTPTNRLPMNPSLLSHPRFRRHQPEDDYYPPVPFAPGPTDPTATFPTSTGTRVRSAQGVQSNQQGAFPTPFDVLPSPTRRRASDSPPQASEGGSAPQPIPSRTRRSPEIPVRARYLRQNTAENPVAASPSASTPPREDRMGPWGARARERAGHDGPLSPPSRTIAPPNISEVTTPYRSVFEDPEFAEAASRVRAAMARARSARRLAEYGEDTEDDTPESRSYRVRRRYNADGDEEVIRVSLRPELSPGFGETSSGGQTREEDTGEEEERDDAWMQALSRLDAMSRETAARSANARSRWGPSQTTRSVNTRVLEHTANSTRSRGWPRLNSQADETSNEGETDYERDIAAMRARARSLITSTAPSRTLGGATLPPPPPTTRPMSFVPTTQGTPGSLWNDSSVRVRLRAAVARLDDDLRRVLDAVNDRTPGSPSPPPLERSGRGAARGGASGANLEQPIWGSPTPFCPSVLPLPLVEDVSGLQARSRTYGGAKRLSQMPRRRAIAIDAIQAGR